MTRQKVSVPDWHERPFMSIEDVSNLLGVSYQHAINLARTERIPGATRYGRIWRVNTRTFLGANGLLEEQPVNAA
jgi:Helix-turn-helix domain